MVNKFTENFDTLQLLENIKKNKIVNSCIGIIILIIILNNIFIQQGVIFCFINLLIALIIILKSKFSFSSLLSILANYPLITLSFQRFTGHSYGMLEHLSLKYGLHYYEINYSVLLFNVVFLFFIYNTKLLDYEKNILMIKGGITKGLINIFCFIAIIATIVYLPRLAVITGLDPSTRFVHLLPGNAWNYVAIVALLFTSLSPKMTKVQIFTLIFVVGWFFLNYERVDMLGLLLFFIIRYSKNLLEHPFIKKIKYKGIILSSVAILGIVFLFATTYLREGRDFKITSLIRDVLVQSTASDIMHVFNTSFEYVENLGTLNGETYLNYIYRIVPGAPATHDYSTILNNYIQNPGGGYFLSEPYMNFGYIGVFIFSIIALLFMYIILRYKNGFTYLLYGCLFAALFRVMWYGLIYIHKSFIMIIPAFYIFLILYNKYVGKKKINAEI